MGWMQKQKYRSTRAKNQVKEGVANLIINAIIFLITLPFKNYNLPF